MRQQALSRFSTGHVSAMNLLLMLLLGAWVCCSIGDCAQVSERNLRPEQPMQPQETRPAREDREEAADDKRHKRLHRKMTLDIPLNHDGVPSRDDIIFKNNDKDASADWQDQQVRYQQQREQQEQQEQQEENQKQRRQHWRRPTLEEAPQQQRRRRLQAQDASGVAAAEEGLVDVIEDEGDGAEGESRLAMKREVQEVEGEEGEAGQPGGLWTAPVISVAEAQVKGASGDGGQDVEEKGIEEGEADGFVVVARDSEGAEEEVEDSADNASSSGISKNVMVIVFCALAFVANGGFLVYVFWVM